jgi:chromosome segregation ATPase
LQTFRKVLFYMSTTASLLSPQELLIRARDALTDLANEKRELEEKCTSLEQSLNKSKTSESALTSALAAARAEAITAQNILEDRERETLTLRDLVSSLREHLRATKTELSETRGVITEANDRSSAADLAKAKFETEEAKLRETLGQWLNAVYGKFASLLKNTNTISLLSSSSSLSGQISSLPPPPAEIDSALSWLDMLPDVSESFKLATAATATRLETKFAEALGACGKLSSRLDSIEREERRGINAMMAVVDSTNRNKEETEAASAALLNEIHRLKVALSDAESMCLELETVNSDLHRLREEAESASRVHREAKEGMERGVIELQSAWESRDAAMRSQIAALEHELTERDRESQSHASRAAILGRRLEHVQNIALPSQVRVLYAGEIERVAKLVHSAESISRGLRTHFERVVQFFKSHTHLAAHSEPVWLTDSRNDMIKELNAALIVAETADALANGLSKTIEERVENAKRDLALRATDATTTTFHITSTPHSTSKAPMITTSHVHPFTPPNPTSNYKQTSTISASRRKTSGMAAFVAEGTSTLLENTN